MSVTIIVWILIMTGNFRGGPIVIDNISSERNCLGLAKSLEGVPQYDVRCVPVRKVLK